MTAPAFTILLEDDYLLVIDKPSGVVVNRAESVKVQTVQDWMDETYKISNLKNQISKITIENQTDPLVEFISRSGVVHRLDKETSGVLLLSKNPEIFEKLKEQFKNRTVAKKYQALVHGRVEPEKASVDAPIGRLPWNRTRFGVFTGGREAQTDYEVLGHYESPSKEPLTLLSLTPHTGRTHQIRVHMQYVGHPLVGDELYAGRKRSRDDREWCPRIFLHARELSFEHPVIGKRITVESQLPEELRTVLDTLNASVK